MTGALSIMEKFKLPAEARFKLRDVIEKRAHDINDVLAQIQEALQFSFKPSAQFLKISDTYLSGQMLSESDLKKIEKHGKAQKKAALKEQKIQKKEKDTISESSNADDASSGSDTQSSVSSSSSSSTKKKKK